MIEEQLFQKHFVGRDGFVWWIGQVVDETKWRDNINGRRVASTEAIPGFGERFKVRIMGYHTANLDDLKDDELPWATVMYPVTAGSGGASASTSAQLRQGTFVFGFFLDGEDAQQPVIMGVLGNNAQTSLEKKVPKIGFLPFSGYTVDNKVAVTNIKTSNEKNKATQVKTPGTTKTPETGVISDTQGATSGSKDLASEQQKKDGNIPTPMAKLTRCGRNDVKGISADIEKLILIVENLTKLSGDFSTQLTGRIDRIQKRIENAVTDAITFVTSKIKNIVEAVRKSIIEKVNDTVKNSYFLFFPNLRPAVKEAQNKTLDLLSCAINKIIQGLLELVGNQIKNVVNKAINVPICLAEGVAGAIVGQVAGFISGLIDSILQPINALLQTVGAAANLAGQILSIIKKIFGLFSCEEELSCPTLDQWSTWKGAGDNRGGPISIESVFNEAQSIGQSAAQAASDLGGAFNPSNLDIGGLVGGAGDALSSLASGCNIGPVECGAPELSIFGSSGNGASGNVVVGAVGEVLAVDLVNGGSGFTSDPSVSINDSCGTGSGATAVPIMSKSTSKNSAGEPIKTIENIAILDSGTDYLSGSNGSEGGSGRVWKKREQSYKKGADGTYFSPVDPGTVIELNPGDFVKVPSPVKTETITIPSNIEFPITQRISITAPNAPITIETLLKTPGIENLTTLNTEQKENLLNRIPKLTPLERQVLLNLPPTIPLESLNPSSDLFTLSPAVYPVILELETVYVKDPGFNYTENDKIVIEPDRGAVLKPIVRNGAVVGVNIEKTATGFDARPRIFVDSDTGFNAELIPVFKVIQVDQNDDRIPPGAKIISVVDCVGKISLAQKS
jgi:hypothetical protein